MNLRINFLLLLISIFVSISYGQAFNQFQVNSFAGEQQNKLVTESDGQGGFVALWQSKYSSAADPWYEVAAQRYDQYGRRIGSEFTISQTTYSTQDAPKITRKDDGSFLVIWESYIDGFLEDIYGRRFDADWNPLTDEFRINTVRSSRQIDANVAFNDSGEFMVVWASFHDVYDPERFWEVRARIYNADATAKTADWGITNDFDNSEPQVAADGDDFIIVHGNSARDIYAAKYSNVGAFISPAHLLAANSVSWGFKIHKDSSDGTLALLYGKSQNSKGNIHVKRFYSFLGELVGDTVLNDPNDLLHNKIGSIDRFPNGHYVVSWVAEEDDDSENFIVQRFSPTFIPLEEQQIVNRVPSPPLDWMYAGNNIDVSVIDDDHYVAAWTYNADGDVDMDIMAAIGPASYLGDFNMDLQVGLDDLVIMANSWLDDEPVIDIAPADGDGAVNLLDFSVLANNWLYDFPEPALVADAGPDQTLYIASHNPVFIILDGSASTGDIVSWLWYWNWDEGGGSEEGWDEISETAFYPGVYNLSLTVTDSSGNTASDDIVITIIQTGP